MIIENIEVIRQRVAAACKKAGRDTREIQILLATKTVTADRIREAILAGYQLIGENKVQEIKQKFEYLQDLKPVQHFIGHLQTNKIKELLKYNVSCIQSVDRFDLALKLHQRLLAENKSMEILVQVNTSGEASKFGVAPEQAVALVQQISNLSSLHIKGLMTIGLFSNNQDKIILFQAVKRFTAGD
ncbi:YggS family pyridoxal phosphate-dependent enzyme [Niabella hibiscisoli]|uniref:YggS family pyridoxal phosphate-dependent enzyme n=1 Tax=Niabella hibiscisoli TaxID=1825928 RepID=UPI001F10ADA2|nr:YggS family pyridoxal phosphate-dependent enzyme [Niabella hibiscisoli]MCH5720080.1 YggS family pyridoxal phosphate-dependent enzyme [Niabella hibiscisoli]